MIHEKFLKLKYKYRNREFWCRGYKVGNNKYKDDGRIHKETARKNQVGE